MRLVIGIALISFIALSAVEGQTGNLNVLENESNSKTALFTFRGNLDEASGLLAIVERSNVQNTFGISGEPNGAISFNSGYLALSALSELYFQSDFIAMAWVRIRRHNDWQRLFDFGNGPQQHNVLFALSYERSGKPTVSIHTAAGGQNLVASKSIPLDIWTHVAFLYKSGTAYIYMNGEEVARAAMNRPERVVRNQNFIGKSNWNNDALLDGDIRDFRLNSFASTIYADYLALGRGSDPNIGNLNLLENEFNSKKSVFVFRGNLDETSGSLSIVERSNVQNTFGISGEPNGAINFNNGYVALSPLSELFLTSDFIAMAWVRIRRHADWQRLFDFGNGQLSNNVVFALSYETSGRPAVSIHTNAGNKVLSASKSIPLNVWTHVAFLYKSGTAYIYLNTEEVGRAVMNRPERVVRTKNYIGRSNWNNDALLDGEVRDFRLSSFAQY